MKKLSVILASLVLFAGVSFASPVAKSKKQQPATEKKASKKSEKKEAPAKKDNSKKADKKAAK
jgi:hypothetical protein